jgi:GTP cyclohydrolase I
VNIDRVAELVKELLVEIGETPERSGLQKTPARVAQAWSFLTEGYSQSVEEVLRNAIFEERYDEMLVARDIEFYSLCEHHLMPFFGKCHIAYMASKRIVGLSKLARAVNVLSRRLQVQERMTVDLADGINAALNPLGVGVVIEAFHTCMAMRGVQKQQATVCSSALRGVFRQNASTRAEFFNLIGVAARSSASSCIK